VCHRYLNDPCIVTLSLEKPTSTVIVLALLDDRYYRGINGRSNWSFDFVLFKRGEPEPLAESSSPRPLARSGNLDIDLAAGEYVIHVSDPCAVLTQSNIIYLINDGRFGWIVATTGNQFVCPCLRIACLLTVSAGLFRKRIKGMERTKAFQSLIRKGKESIHRIQYVPDLFICPTEQL
jgi:hypothetical protein